MAVEIISFPNGRQKLIYQNYVYIKLKELVHGIICWECCNRRNVRSCKAKIKTLDGVFQGSINTHTCAVFGNPEKVAALRSRAEIVLQANSSDDRSHTIIGSKTQALSDNVKAYLPRIETMKRGIRRLRESNNLPAPDRNDMNFEIPDE